MLNPSSVKAAKRLVPQNYIEQAVQATKKHQALISILLEQRKCPKEGWPESTVRFFIQQLSSMDSNNFVNSCGVGEREARFASEIVAQRHFRMGHGIGRSGDVTEAQPKAAGSSLLNVLANALVLDILKHLGVPTTEACFIVPLATGMSMTLCLLTLRKQNPKARYVIWSRIDQKSCLKSIYTAGFEPIVVEPLIVKDELHTNMAKITELLETMDATEIACILSTTSCFAPRAPDDIVGIAKLCKTHNVPHLINNAYGLQCPPLMSLIVKASRKGRVDAFIQSTDKNFMVPVGGAIIAGFDPKFISSIGKLYPGRGSACPSLDVLITLLTLGLEGYQNLIINRNTMLNYLKEQLKCLATQYQERLLETPSNPISVGISLSSMDSKDLTELGSMLFTKLVSGTRVVVPGETKTIEDLHLVGWGSHCHKYHTPYLTAAASIGITKKDIDTFILRLNKVMQKFKDSFFKSMIAQSQFNEDSALPEATPLTKQSVEEESDQRESGDQASSNGYNLKLDLPSAPHFQNGDQSPIRIAIHECSLNSESESLDLSDYSFSPKKEDIGPAPE